MGSGRTAARQGRNDGRFKKPPQNMHPRWTWDSGYLRASRGGKAGQKPRSDLVSCWCSAGFAITIHEKTAHLLGPCLKEKGCDTCDTCDTCKRLPSREVHRYTISLPSFHLRLWIWCYHPRGLAPDLRTTQSISVPTHGPDDVCDP